MKIVNFVAATVCALSLFTIGCASTEIIEVDTSNDTGDIVEGLDARDFEHAAGVLVDSMLESRALDKPDGSRYVVAVSRVKNDTMMHLQPRLITSKITSSLLKSGKAVVTAAISGDGSQDALISGVRDLAADDNVNQATVAGKGQIIAPDLSLSGTIVERKNRIGKTKRERTDYFFMMQLAEINTGLIFWEDEMRITKKDAK